MFQKAGNIENALFFGLLFIRVKEHMKLSPDMFRQMFVKKQQIPGSQDHKKRS